MVKSLPTPASSLIWVDQGPAAFTTTSASIDSALLISIPATRLPFRSTLVTELLNRNSAPLAFAAAAKFSAASCGSSTYPPCGVKIAPTCSLASFQNSSLVITLGGQYFPVSKSAA